MLPLSWMVFSQKGFMLNCDSSFQSYTSPMRLHSMNMRVILQHCLIYSQHWLVLLLERLEIRKNGRLPVNENWYIWAWG